MPRVKQPTLIRAEKLRSVLGEEAFSAIMTELLRKEAGKVAPWYPEDVEAAKKFLDKDDSVVEAKGVRTAQRQAFLRLALKFVGEAPSIDRRFREYIDSLDNKNQTSEWRCPICDSVFSTKTSLQTHKMWHSRDRSEHACPVCGAMTKAVQTHIASSGDEAHKAYYLAHKNEPAPAA